jgi:cytoskeletal protein RodZ
MPSVGAYLRQMRESRGVSLEEIARVTRVTASYLHALEADDYDSLPVPVFTRGFIRAYCQALGVSPDEAMALFEGRGESAAPTTAPVTGAPTAPRPASASRVSTEPAPRNRGPVLVSFILLVVLGVALFAVTLVLQSGRVAPESPRAGRAPAPPASAPASPGTAGAPAAPAAPRLTGYRLVARTVEPTWIRVKTDDGRTVEENIPAGQTREWFSTGPFTLTVGNAGGIALELNGRALPPLGPSGTVIPRLVVPTESQ